MLRATIELCPYGRTDDESRKTLIVVDYFNVNNRGDYADYGYKIDVYETTDATSVRARPADDEPRVTSHITGTVLNFPRRVLGSAHLLARVLEDAGFNAKVAD